MKKIIESTKVFLPSCPFIEIWKIPRRKEKIPKINGNGLIIIVICGSILTVRMCGVILK